MPVIQVVELHGDAVAVLELGSEQQFRVKLELQEVATQLLHVLFNDDLDGFTCTEEDGKCGQQNMATDLDTRPRKQAGM